MAATTQSNRRNSQFRKGTGCYNCDVCGKLTRNTGEQSLGSKTCPKCWEEAGLENEHSDTNGDHYGEGFVAGCPCCRAEAEAAPAEVVAATGRLQLLRRVSEVDWRAALGGHEVVIQRGTTGVWSAAWGTRSVEAPSFKAIIRELRAIARGR